MSYPVPSKTYRHHKGNLYRVEDLAEHSETGETLVVYRQVGSRALWVRPLTGSAGWATPIEGKQERFKLEER